MSSDVGSAIVFSWELFVGVVAGVGDIDTKEEREGIVKGSVLVSLAEIVLVTG